MVSQAKVSRISIYKILLATDLSPEAQNALQCAVSLARRYGAKLFLTHVLAPDLSEASMHATRYAISLALQCLARQSLPPHRCKQVVQSTFRVVIGFLQNPIQGFGMSKSKGIGGNDVRCIKLSAVSSADDRGRSAPTTARSSPGVRWTSGASPKGWSSTLHPAGKTDAERLYRELQRQVPRRVSERELVRLAQRCAAAHRAVAAVLQPGASALGAGLQNAGGVCSRSEKLRNHWSGARDLKRRPLAPHPHPRYATSAGRTKTGESLIIPGLKTGGRSTRFALIC